jgi:hypothetical protein
MIDLWLAVSIWQVLFGATTFRVAGFVVRYPA